VLVRPGHADGIIGATLGYGRSRAGRIGNGIGFDVYSLRTSEATWVVENAAIARTGKKQQLPLTQHFFALEGEAKEVQPP